MSAASNKTVLIAGDTPRWIERAKKSLPENCTIRTATNFAHVIEILMNEDLKIDLCILANNLSEKDAGLRIVQELQEEDDPKVILYTREISDADKRVAEELGAVVIEMNTTSNMEDTEKLAHAVKTLLAA
jgi:CheY-like chemotaxis protein